MAVDDSHRSLQPSGGSRRPSGVQGDMAAPGYSRMSCVTQPPFDPATGAIDSTPPKRSTTRWVLRRKEQMDLRTIPARTAIATWSSPDVLHSVLGFAIKMQSKGEKLQSGPHCPPHSSSQQCSHQRTTLVLLRIQTAVLSPRYGEGKKLFAG